MKLSKSVFSLLLASAAVTAAPAPAHALDICRELLESVWVPPTPMDPVECLTANADICWIPGMHHCCGPTCRLHLECELGGSFIDGHWSDITCESMSPEEALRRWANGTLDSLVDASVGALIQAAAQYQIALRAGARSLPPHVVALVEEIRRSPVMEGLPTFLSTHITDARFVTQTAAGDALYSDSIRATTLDDLVVMRDDLYDALFNEPPRTLAQLRCGQGSRAFRNALEVLLHELVHVRQFDEMGRDAFLATYILQILAEGYEGSDLEDEAFEVSFGVREPLVDQRAVLAFVHANQPATASYLPARFSMNATSPFAEESPVIDTRGRPSVTRSAAGTYSVSFPGIGRAGGTAHVTAVGALRSCRVRSNGTSGANQVVGVECRAPNGVLTDTQFTLAFVEENRMCAGYGYTQAAVSNATHTPFDLSSHVEAPVDARITRTGVGAYSILLPGFSVVGGHVEVSAFGSASTRCKVQSWANAAAGATVTARCFNTAGAAADTRFQVLYAHRNVPGRLDAVENLGAYLWNDQPAAALNTNYSPHATYRMSTGGVPSLRRTATGVYAVTLPGMPVGGSAIPLVTAYGADTNACAVHSFSTAAAGASVEVRCFNNAGAAANAQFTLVWITDVADFG